MSAHDPNGAQNSIAPVVDYGRFGVHALGMDQLNGTLTTSEVAREFSVAPSTVKRWVDSGRLPVAFRTIGGHARFDAEAVAKLKDERRGEA